MPDQKKRNWISPNRIGVACLAAIVVGQLVSCDMVKEVASDLDDAKELVNKIDKYKNLASGQQQAAPPPQMSPTPAQNARLQSNELIVGSFNIQVFGVKKIQNQNVAAVLVDIVRHFDVIAIQELRSIDQSVIPTFVSWLNSDGSSYNYAVGPRQGYSNSKEQYVYIYDTRRVEITNPGFVVPDPQNRIHRPPLATAFRVRVVPPQQAFSFVLANIHTDPDQAYAECDALADSVAALRQYFPYEDDVIVLGDLNAPPSRLGRLTAMQNWGAILPEGVTTNTRKNRSYDNIVINGAATSEYTGRFGVVDLMNQYNLTMDQALTVSDHLPVWATFSVYESNNNRFAGGRPRGNW